MTREEAIKYLSEEQKKTEEVMTLTERDFGVSESVWHTEYEAFNLAISALREQPRWISVEERLPEAEKEVRVLCKASWNSKYRYQCQAFYEPKGMLREKSDYGWDYECCSEYSEEDDDYFVNPGWYERIHNWDDYGAVGIADEVTHWIPLPDAPEVEV